MEITRMAGSANDASVSAFIVTLQTLAAAFFADAGVRSIISAVLLALALSVLVAWRKGEFTFYRLPDFLKDQLPYAAIYFALKLFAEQAGWGAVVPVAFGLIMLKFGSSVLDSLAALGVPIPQSVLELVRKSGSVK